MKNLFFILTLALLSTAGFSQAGWQAPFPSYFKDQRGILANEKEIMDGYITDPPMQATIGLMKIFNPKGYYYTEDSSLVFVHDMKLSYSESEETSVSGDSYKIFGRNWTQSDYTISTSPATTTYFTRRIELITFKGYIIGWEARTIYQ